jgi:lipoprotein-anchoring transpeptidase ErfK/SrfK
MMPGKNENLRSGIEAARANQFEKARTYLTQVLDQDPLNIPAMFWLAYVAPSPQESISLLERILTLQPGNECALAGIRWAERRMTPSAAKTQPEPPRPQAASAQPDQETSPPAKIARKRLLSAADARKQARKSALAHRARRTIDPLLAVVVIIGAATMLSVGIWALMFGPPATLAAWFPVSIESFSAASSVVSTPLESPTSPAQEGVAPKNFTSKTDTIVIEIPQPSEEIALITEADPLNISPIPAAGSDQEASPALAANEQIAPASPVTFIGPAEQLLDGPRLFQPVDEARLAYRPNSPDEKWIEVDVTKQRVTAWEGNTPVMAFISSTGLPNTPTVLGKFNIYWKLESTLMVGPGYYLPQVPHTMYFYAGYSLHGAYWHNNFGQPMSHGCVNLSLDDARELFEWADPVIPPGQTEVVASANNPGSLVVVHD